MIQVGRSAGVIVGFVAATFACALVAALLGSPDVLLYLLPTALLVLPLALGRYLGEQSLESMRARWSPRRARARDAAVPTFETSFLPLLDQRMLAASRPLRGPPALIAT